MEVVGEPKLNRVNVEIISNMKEKFEETSNLYHTYLEYLKDEQFEDKPNETEEEAIKRAESVYDRFDEIVQRREIVLKNGKDTIDLIENVKMEMENVVNSCENDKIRLFEKNNCLIDKIIDLEESKLNKEIEPLQNQIDLLKQRFNNKKNEWDDQRMSSEEFKQIKIQKDNLEEMVKIIDLDEMKQIEEWTQMKFGNIIFNSDVDDCSYGSEPTYCKGDLFINHTSVLDLDKHDTSVFDQKIINKSNLIILIEDEGGNKFGGYVNAIIEKTGDWTYDLKSFLFTLKSNGRLEGMMKFENVKPERAFYLYSSGSTELLKFGHNQDAQTRGGPKYDLLVEKKRSNYISTCVQEAVYYGCTQRSFDYHGIEKALCGNEEFTPKRITVFQLI